MGFLGCIQLMGYRLNTTGAEYLFWLPLRLLLICCNTILGFPKVKSLQKGKTQASRFGSTLDRTSHSLMNSSKNSYLVKDNVKTNFYGSTASVLDIQLIFDVNERKAYTPSDLTIAQERMQSIILHPLPPFFKLRSTVDAKERSSVILWISDWIPKITANMHVLL